MKLNEYPLVNREIESKKYMLDDSTLDNNNFSSYEQQYSRITRVIAVLSNLQLGIYILIAIFLLAIFFIIYSVIHNFVYFYKDEIHITKLVGGGNIFVYGPFSLQGGLYSFSALVISFLAFIIILQNISFLFSRLLGVDVFLLLDGKLLPLFIGEVLIFVGLGVLSGYISSKKYIQK